MIAARILRRLENEKLEKNMNEDDECILFNKINLRDFK